MKRFVLLATLISPGIWAQNVEDPVVLKIDIENHVLYRGTVWDATQIGREPGPLPLPPQVGFVPGINIGDIVAINGTPVKGIWTSSFSHTTPFRTAPQPGQFIADFDSGATFYCTWQIFALDGTYLGMIRDSGAGPVGGHALTGALAGFFGAIGTHGGMALTGSRTTSYAENPANRRNHGGGRGNTTFYLYPRTRPAVQVTAAGPSVFHSDFSVVTAANPARPGETLIVAAVGLGPVKPNLEPPGAVTFSSSPVQEVNSPVSVAFNGKELPVINKIGWPGQKNLYRVDFQVPSEAASGNATLQLTAMWIPGPAVTIPIAMGSR
jgi:hypothetical protein